MASKRYTVIFWAVLLVANIYSFITYIVEGSVIGIIFALIGVILSAWLTWDAYQNYKAEKWAVKTMQNFYITINNAETDAKEAAAKIAQDIQHTLRDK
jgi:ABC-type lipoprotein release transport system permease subunit